MPSAGAALGFSASQLLQLQFQLAIGRCMCVRTAQWKIVDFGAFSVERRHVVVWFFFLATLTSVEDGRVLIASRRRREISLIFGRPMRAFTVLTRPLGSSRTTSKRVSRPLFPLGGRYSRPIHVIGSSFVNATLSPSPVQVAPRPSVSATLLYTRYCCARARPSPGFVPPSLVLILLLYTPSPHMRPYTSPPARGHSKPSPKRVSTLLPRRLRTARSPPCVHIFCHRGPPLLVGGLEPAHLKRPGFAHPPLFNDGGDPLFDNVGLRAL